MKVIVMFEYDYDFSYIRCVITEDKFEEVKEKYINDFVKKHSEIITNVGSCPYTLEWGEKYQTGDGDSGTFGIKYHTKQLVNGEYYERNNAFSMDFTKIEINEI